MLPTNPDITLLLQAAATGDTAAGDRLIIALYDQLRAAAQRQIAGERAGHTLTATALVHEAYFKLAGPREVPWQNRAHFYAAAAEAMRRILLDHAKHRQRDKRGGGQRIMSLNEAASLDMHAPGGSHAVESKAEPIDHIALDRAITELAEQDPRAAQVVRLRYYAGLQIEQTAHSLGISPRTVKNDWSFARAWLQRRLGSDAEREAAP